jgi:hypothetical protein
MNLDELFERRLLSALTLAARHRLPPAWQALTPQGDARAAASVLVRLAGKEWQELPALVEEVEGLAQTVNARRQEAGREGEPVWQDLARALAELRPDPSSTSLFELQLWDLLPTEEGNQLKKELRALAPRNKAFPIRPAFLPAVARTLMTARARAWADAEREQNVQRSTP